MRLMNRPYWIVGFKIFTTILYYAIIVPIVFAILFVPLSIALSPLTWIRNDQFLPAFGAACGAIILAPLMWKVWRS